MQASSLTKLCIRQYIPCQPAAMPNFFIAVALLLCSLVLALADEWDPASFKKNVTDDNRIWLVEFYSTRCGGCKEFSPTWDKVVASMKSLLATKVNIEETGGMAIAKEMGVLSEGIPNVRIFKSKSVHPTGESIVIGDLFMTTVSLIMILYH